MPKSSARRRYRAIAAAVLTAPLISACALMASLPGPTNVDQRLAAIPTTGVPVREPVEIYWNENQVPFIEAQNDDDLAVALGIVHAHLRLGQLELLRLISQGRLSEAAGPFTRDVDHAIRLLGYGRAVPGMIEMMPTETRRWLEHFVAGLNYYLRHVDQLPHEFDIGGLDRREWTVDDILTIGRLVSSDVNWFVWSRLLPLRDRPDWQEVWERSLRYGGDSVASFDDAGASAMLENLLLSTTRSGSNSLVIAGERSETGGALIASDPHLGIQLPNPWLIVGYKSPSHHAVGFMIPGLPFMALGRNPWIAWGGTNMRAASSDLYDVSDLPADQITNRTDTLSVRWWFDREIDIRETDWGPIISDAAILGVPEGQKYALRWLGHHASDEVTAMLHMNRARNWDEFKAALDGFAVPGQNMVYADADGHIGQVMAVHLPQRNGDGPSDLTLDPADQRHWDNLVTTENLPKSYDPPSGFLASANNRPAHSPIPVSYFFSPDDRIVRLRDLLSEKRTLSVDDLIATHTDVYMSTAVALRDQMVAGLNGRDDRIATMLADWDGHYRADSVGAVVFELMLNHLLEAFYADDERTTVSASGRLLEMMRDDLAAAPEAKLNAAIRQAAQATAAGLDQYANWGAMHRMQLGHPLRFAPVIGGRYQAADYPVGGSRQTLMKTAHGATADRHRTGYGSTARHISDLSDPNANYFVLLGGQDGWLGSENFLDQVNLWQNTEYIQVPLEPDSVRTMFKRKTSLSP